MTYYHIIIATERRTDPARQATPILEQLHSFSDKQPTRWVSVMVPNPATKPDDWDEDEEGYWPTEVDRGYWEFDPKTDDPQFVMIAEWDGFSPYVIAHKGDYATRSMAYAGWPDQTKEQFDALAADPVAT